VQLDDLDQSGPGSSAARSGRPLFSPLQTTPENHQAWVALSGITDPPNSKDFRPQAQERLGRRCDRSGATRVAGTTNYKCKHDPDFPKSPFWIPSPAVLSTPAHLEASGLVAEPEPRKTGDGRPLPVSRGHEKAVRTRTLAGLSATPGSGSAQSRQYRPGSQASRFVRCITALDWGYSTEETANKLWNFALRRVRTASDTPYENKAAVRENAQGRG
jgi:hypothetical protein